MKLAHIAIAAVAVGGLASASGAQAVTRWQAHHPVRTYDNARLARQNERITQGVRDGQLTHGEAHALRSDDHAIRTEERADSAVSGSHLTRTDQRQINSQLNANSRAIYDGRHD